MDLGLDNDYVLWTAVLSSRSSSYRVKIHCEDKRTQAFNLYRTVVRSPNDPLNSARQLHILRDELHPIRRCR